MYLPVAWFMLFASGFFWSPMSTAVAVVVLLAPMALLSAFLYRRFRLLSIVAIVVGVLGPGFATAHSLDSTAPPPDYLAERLDEVGVPAGWVMRDESRHAGNAICFDICPGVCRLFQPAEPPTLATVDRAMERFTQVGFKQVDEERASDRWPYRYARAPHLFVTVSIGRWSQPRSSESEPVISVCLEGRESPRVP